VSTLPAPRPPDVAPLPRPTPEEALDRLITGNQRFAAGAPSRPNQDGHRRDLLTNGQEPFAVVLGCADSRVPAELVFDQGLGDLFVCRTAGPVVDHAILGSVEFAVEHLHVPLIVVLGHERCGAVTAAAQMAAGAYEPTGAVRDLVERVLPVAMIAAREGGSPEEQISRAVALNVQRVIDVLLDRSRLLTDAVADGSVGLVGAVYELDGGLTRFL
jgi:carbonic anhydrase